VRIDQKLQDEQRPQHRAMVLRQHVQADRDADQGERGDSYAVAIDRDPVMRSAAVDCD
jgi:hypothetical protein